MQNSNEKSKKKFLKINFDMIKSDKEFYLENCNFNETQEKIFLYLTDKKYYSRIQIAFMMNMSESYVDKVIRQIKLKMIRAIAFS